MQNTRDSLTKKLNAVKAQKDGGGESEVVPGAEITVEDLLIWAGLGVGYRWSLPHFRSRTGT